ncbi:reverse transcriptase domain-containing protein [Tanacetum coccineum]
MTTSVEKQNHAKFCEFHGEVGHNTDECIHLKKQIEEMLKAGKLSHIIKELKQRSGKEQPKSGQAKDHIKLFLQPRNPFPPLGEDEGTEGLMIIEAEIGGHCIHRMYVDGGSASEILYEHCFNRLRLKIKNQLVPATTPLIGFSGEIIWPIGQIQLLVKIGDEEHSTSALMNFVVVRILKIPVEGGVIILKSSRMVPLECAVVSRPEGNPSATKKAVEEVVKLAINLEHPEQTKPVDMTGVPRYIAEHRLNVREGCSPVRQKKRGQAANQNQVIQEEVGKLVEAGIMKEVHYHDWLSNPVMVKKHGDSWRMCVDFKDLNKACLKDGYPLPEIDWKVESLCGFPFKCFLDAYKGYHQIQMAKKDEEKTTFITSQGIFYYTKMAFGLRNAGATYQCLVDKAFHKQIRRNLKVYVDDLVIKSCTEDEIVRDIEETFKTLREINKLNPKKCTFGVEEGMFLGYKVNTKGLKVCLDKGIKGSGNKLHINGKIIAGLEVEEELSELWILFTDGSSCTDGFGAGLILINPEGMEFTYALRFSEAEILEVVEEEGNTWMTPIFEYLTEETLLADEKKARAVRRKSQRFAIIKGILYKKSFLGPLLCLGEGIKARLGAKNKNWLEELSHVLWAHRTMIKSSNGETLFSLTYGTEAVIPAEIGMPTLRTVKVDLVQNNEALEINLDLLEEKQEQATICKAESKAKMEKYYNSKVRGTSFKPGDLVYRNNDASHAEDT